FIETRWASYLANRKLQPATLDLYSSIISKHLLPFFGEDMMSEITTARVTDFFDGLTGRLKEGTIGNVYKVLNMIFDVAFEYDYVASKPLRRKLHKPEYERQEKPTLPVEQARELLRGLTYSHRLFIATLSVLT